MAPHLHLITTDAGRTKDGSWHPVPEWDGLRLMTVFRERLLAKLVETGTHPHEQHRNLQKPRQNWSHPR